MFTLIPEYGKFIGELNFLIGTKCKKNLYFRKTVRIHTKPSKIHQVGEKFPLRCIATVVVLEKNTHSSSNYTGPQVPLSHTNTYEGYSYSQ